MRSLSLIFYVAVIALGVIFAGLNANLVGVDYYIGTAQVPLAALLISAFTLGAFLGLFTGFLTTLKLKFKNKKLTKDLELAKKEVSQLRKLSIKED